MVGLQREFTASPFITYSLIRELNLSRQIIVVLGRESKKKQYMVSKEREIISIENLSEKVLF